MVNLSSPQRVAIRCRIPRNRVCRARGEGLRLWGVQAQPPFAAAAGTVVWKAWTRRADNRAEIRDFLATPARQDHPGAGRAAHQRAAPGARAAPRGGRRPRRREHRVVHPAGEGPHQRRVRGRPRRGRPRPAAGRGRTHLPVRPGQSRPARPPRAVAAARTSRSRPASSGCSTP